MVSLEKRCIIVNYGIVPTHDYGIVLAQADMQTAVINPHVAMPDGAGWQVGRVSSTWYLIEYLQCWSHLDCWAA